MKSECGRGFTLVELLMTIVIALVMILAFAGPFMAERIFWTKGKQQAEAQRDAQFVLHAIARVARECNDTTVSSLGANSTRVTLQCPPCATGVPAQPACPCGTPVTFRGGPAFNSGQLQQEMQGGNNTLIDGVRSRATHFSGNYTNPMLHLELQIDHGSRNGTESVKTDVLLRNASGNEHL